MCVPGKKIAILVHDMLSYTSWNNLIVDRWSIQQAQQPQGSTSTSTSYSSCARSYVLVFLFLEFK